MLRLFPLLDKISSQTELDAAITALDAALFDACNRCDFDKFSWFFVDDVEFYHDQGGVTLGEANLTDRVKKNICGKVTRVLVPGTLQVYHMKGYGAVQIGVHQFVAIQRRSMEDDASHQLRSSPCR